MRWQTVSALILAVGVYFLAARAVTRRSDRPRLQEEPVRERELQALAFNGRPEPLSRRDFVHFSGHGDSKGRLD